jgi:hypothetical protein
LAEARHAFEDMGDLIQHGGFSLYERVCLSSPRSLEAQRIAKMTSQTIKVTARLKP